MSEVFGENAQSRSQHDFVTASRDHTFQSGRFFFCCVCFRDSLSSGLHVGAFVFVVVRTTQTDETGSPRDTEKTAKSDVTEAKKQSCCMNGSYHENFRATKFLRKFKWFFIRVGTRNQKCTTKKQPKITVQKHPYLTSDSHYMHIFLQKSSLHMMCSFVHVWSISARKIIKES